jgi:hypothetical protein
MVPSNQSLFPSALLWEPCGLRDTRFDLCVLATPKRGILVSAFAVCEMYIFQTLVFD